MLPQAKAAPVKPGQSWTEMKIEQQDVAGCVAVALGCSNPALMKVSTCPNMHCANEDALLVALLLTEPFLKLAQDPMSKACGDG